MRRVRLMSLRDELLPEAAALFDPQDGGGEGAGQRAAGAVPPLLRARRAPAHCTQRTFRGGRGERGPIPLIKKL